MPSFRRPLRASEDAVNKTILEQELAPLEAEIEKAQQKLEALGFTAEEALPPR